MLRALVATLTLLLVAGCTPKNLAQVAKGLQYAASHPNAALVRYDVRAISMEPTYHRGDILLVDLRAYAKSEPKRGDVVVFDPPIAVTGLFLKRIVAIPGDRVRIQGGRLYVNGNLDRQPNYSQAINYDLKIAAYKILVHEQDQKEWVTPVLALSRQPSRSQWRSSDRVPDGYYFALGDNRNDSEDSHVFGFVSRQAIRGKVVEKL